jgi:hypothetical protein
MSGNPLMSARGSSAVECRPVLSAKSVGHLRHTLRLAQQLPGDWSNMGSDWWDIGEGAQQYELAFMTYMLGIVQHQYTPAYREFCQTAIEKLIGKMMLPDIWEKWINASRGGKTVNPDQTELGAGWIDPIKKHNVMYKGHLLQMAAMYEALYRDGKYARTGAFKFEFKATTWGMGSETFLYDVNELAKIIHNEYVESNYEGVQCEPNRIFPMCNQHAVLGLWHHDQAFGTDYAADVMPKFKAAWLRKGYTDCKTNSHMRMRWAAQDKIFPSCHPWSDGWTGIFMHAWDREFIRSLYPSERARHLEPLLAGKEGERVYSAMVPTSAKLGFGMFTALAAELGDIDSRDRLLDYAERNFSPRWDDGCYWFPRSDAWMPDGAGNSHGVDMLTGNALLPLARVNQGGGIWELYNSLRPMDFAVEPHFAAIDHSVVSVSQAHYDYGAGTLHISLVPAREGACGVSFEIRNLRLEQKYIVQRDGEVVGTLSYHAPKSIDSPLQWSKDGAVSIRSVLDRPCSFVIAPIT